MSLRFSIYIGVLGAAALAAVAWPSLVLMGLFLGVIPGLVLWVAPSLFIYSVLWWSVRAILLRIPIPAWISSLQPSRFAIPVLSSAIVAVPAILVPYGINMRTEEAAQSLRAGDIEPQAPVVLPSVVALVMDGNTNWSKRRPFCETLCLRLLFNSAVARVIAVDPARPNSATAFWIEQREACPEDTDFRSMLFVRWATDFPLKRGDNLEDRVRARIASGECLMAGEGRPEEAATTIAYRTQKGASIFDHPWALEPGPPAVNRLEISDAGGATLYRRTEVRVFNLTAPLQIATAAGPLTTVTYAGWARTETVLGQIGPHGRDVLPQIFGNAVRKPDLNSQGVPR